MQRAPARSIGRELWRQGLWFDRAIRSVAGRELTRASIAPASWQPTRYDLKRKDRDRGAATTPAASDTDGMGVGKRRPYTRRRSRRIDQVQLKSVLLKGNERTRLPVAAKIALAIAGATGGITGSPTPVVGLSVFRKCISIFAGVSGMRIIG